MLTPEELSKLQLLRARLSAGEQIDIAEMKDAIAKLRANRLAAAERAKVSRRTAKPVARSATDLLATLGIGVPPSGS